VGRFQLIRTARAAGGPTLDTAQALKSELNLASTTAPIAHVNLLWFDSSDLQEVFFACNFLIWRKLGLAASNFEARK
jgi:hypothetical protein